METYYVTCSSVEKMTFYPRLCLRFERVADNKDKLCNGEQTLCSWNSCPCKPADDCFFLQLE